MASSDPFQQVFDTAKKDFLDSVASSNPSLERNILATKNIEDVYEVAEKLQTEQAKRRRMRNVNRIMPYLECLRDYADEIEVFVQVKPEIIALIWGPAKLLLLWVGNLKNGFDAVAGTMERIGELLPQFKRIKDILQGEDRLKGVLALFYKDILDFYSTALNFFGKSRWEVVFESMWPKCKEKIKVIEANIERHSRLLREEVTFEHIRLENEHRAKSLEAFQKAEDDQLRQKYQALEMAVRPRLYDDKLDWLRTRTCQGTAKWLAKEDAFTKWLDTTKQLSKILWIQGIPGAGKTFLASSIIDTVRERHRTIYVFASYAYTETRAISVIHSFLFQLASDDKSLQTVLTELNQRDLKSNTKFAAETLKQALQCAGITFLVIDGLDELDDFERRQVLQYLLEILADCQDTRICLSSRVEDDIDKIIGKSSTAIRVDHRNSASIQSYVDTRFKRWAEYGGFDKEDEMELQGLLSLVAIQAQGMFKHPNFITSFPWPTRMFLYARIVIDNAELLSDIDEIRAELKALPKDLDAAYDRAFSKINTLAPTSRERARKILGWIGCAPVPLTIYEIEQALLVKPGMSDAPVVRSPTRVAQLCGPIVEVAGDRPQFVHFTVKEYIFNTQVKDFISMSDAVCDLVKTCWIYLYSRALDDEALESEIDNGLLSGKFRFLNFASFNWLPLLRTLLRLSKDKTHLEILLPLLEEFRSERANDEFTKDQAEPQYAEVVITLPDAPATSEFLSRALMFFQDPRQEEWTIDNAKVWTKFDPLSVSQASVLIDKRHKRLLCRGKTHDENGCHCSTFKSHYGPRLYKCIFFSCPFRRTGFLSSQELDHHVKYHNRPYKCRFKDCDPYAQVGFLTREAETEHWYRFHYASEKEQTSTGTSNPQTKDELIPLLFELVRSENVDDLSKVWPRCRSNMDFWVERELLKTAAAMGSLPVTRLLCDAIDSVESDTASELATASISSENIDLVRYALKKSISRGFWGGFHGEIELAVMKSPSLEVSAVWQETVEHLRSPLEYDLLRSMLGSPSVWRAAKRNPMQETRFLETLRRLSDRGDISPLWLGIGLVNVADSSYSVTQAAALLEAGASVNQRKCQPWVYEYGWGKEASYEDLLKSQNRKRRQGMTALHYAAKSTSEDAAHLMKFLLLKGADDQLGYAHVKPRDEKGAQNISHWLGMTWDELVRWAKEERISKGA